MFIGKYWSVHFHFANSFEKTSSSAGFEPATSGLEVRRAIHCATKTDVLSMYDSSNRDLPASVGGVKVSIVAFQAIDPGSIPGRRTRFFPSHVALFLLALYATVGCDLASSFKDI